MPKESTAYHRHISAEKKFFRLGLKDVWRYRDLVLLYARRSLVVTYKQTILGPLWLFINPLLSSILHLFLFGNLAGFQTGGVPKILFYLFSNTAWNFFSTTATQNAALFTNNSRVFEKVRFPRLTISYADMLSALVPLACQLGLGAVFLAYYALRGQVTVSWAFPLALLMLLQMGLMGQGVGLLFAAVTTRYRDARMLLQIVMRFLTYMSPVVYPLAQLGDGWLRTLMLFNPLTGCLEAMRFFLWGAPFPPAAGFVGSLIFTCGLYLMAILLFNRAERTFIDTI